MRGHSDLHSSRLGAPKREARGAVTALSRMNAASQYRNRALGWGGAIVDRLSTALHPPPIQKKLTTTGEMTVFATTAAGPDMKRAARPGGAPRAFAHGARATLPEELLEVGPETLPCKNDRGLAVRASERPDGIPWWGEKKQNRGGERKKSARELQKTLWAANPV